MFKYEQDHPEQYSNQLEAFPRGGVNLAALIKPFMLRDG